MLHAIFHWHSFVEIQTDSFSILVDPFINWNTTCDITLEQLKQKHIKAVILTHGHSDHIGDSLEILKNSDILLISTFEVTKYFTEQKWVTNVHWMNIWWEFNFWEYTVKLTPAFHTWTIDKPWNGYVTSPAWAIVRIWWKSIYHAWDTGLSYEMKLLWEFDKIDIAFLPIGDNFTMWIKDSVIATSFIKPWIVVPIHYNTWTVINADPIEFARLVMLENLSVPKVLNPWQYVVL